MDLNTVPVVQDRELSYLREFFRDAWCLCRLKPFESIDWIGLEKVVLIVVSTERPFLKNEAGKKTDFPEPDDEAIIEMKE